ncbi:MAG: efflux RND transporter periplasmic adaptor subunit [Planctomycetales bacterium]|nr:efflux RND transporter periplasmic adaptor subunit [Planctomycetales bacterium]MBN8626268.1 efflux RND transporter periplasmic adaptor subunit [Planctomycetota bacterium]
MIGPTTEPVEPREVGAPARPASSGLRERVLSLQLPAGAKSRPAVPWLRYALAGLAIVGLLAVAFNAAEPWLAKVREQRDEQTLAEPEPAGQGTAAPNVATAANATTPAVAVAPSSPTAASPSSTGAVAAPTGKIVLESRGYVVPAHQILVSPKVQGMVVKLDIEEGRRVEKGALLAEIESIEYQRDYERATAMHELAKARLTELENGSRPEEIGQAEAELAQAKEELVDIERIWRRNVELWKTRSVTEAEWQQSESKHLAMLRRIDQLQYALQLLRKGPREERIVAARAEARQYEADALKAKWRLDNCRIVAPISGTILKKNAEEGNLVNTLAMNGSFSLCEMADLSDLEIDLKIQERDVAKVFVDQACRIRCEAYPDRVYEGYVSRLMPIADRAQAAVPVRVKVRVPSAEEGVYLKPEMGANVSFYDGKDPQRLSAGKK